MKGDADSRAADPDGDDTRAGAAKPGAGEHRHRPRSGIRPRHRLIPKGRAKG
ncbi:hypothetical protein ACLOJK_010476 [Asimina triloba]